MTARSRRGLVVAALALSWGLAIFAGAKTAVAADPRDAHDVRIISEQKVKDRVIDLTIATPAFAAPTKVEVILPTGYDTHPSRRWPVTYFTAGTMNNYNTYREFLSGDKLASAYPSIIVSPDSNSGYWSDWYNGGAFGPPKYETFVIDQLIALIDARFRTIAHRAQRAIFGISMGGYGAMMFAARHPDLFVAAASLSGAVDSNLTANGAVLSASSTFDGAAPDAIYGPRAEQEVRWRGHNPTDLAANLRGLDLQVRTANGILNPGIGEGTATAGDVPSCVVEGGVHMASVDFHQQLDALGIPHVWKDYGPGCHTAPNFKREVLDTLAVFERVLANPPTPPATFDYQSIQPHFDLWGWTVDADPARALEFLKLDDAGRGGATFTGSGTTTATTPAIFRDVLYVDVVGAGKTRRVIPDEAGRITFSVDLGAAHPNQQYTAQARAAGQDANGYFTTRTITFRAHRITAGHLISFPRARSCRRRSLRLRLRHPRGTRVRKATVYVNGRRARVLTGRSLRGTITLRALPAGVLRVRIVVQTATRRTFTSRRTYAACR